MPLHHPGHAKGQCDGDHGRKAFGDRGHRQAHGREKHRDHRDAAQFAEKKDDRYDPQREPQQTVPQLLEPALQRRLFALGLLGLADHRRDLPEFRMAPGVHHKGTSLPGDGYRSHKEHVVTVSQRDLGLRQGFYRLGDRRRFAGQRGFLRLEAGRIDETRISRDPIARLDLDEVAGNQLAGGERHEHAVTNDPRSDDCHVFERLQRALGPIFLNKAENRVQDDDGNDRGCIHPFLKQSRHDGCPDQNPDNQARELCQEDGER